MKIIFTLLCASFSLLFLSHCREEGGTMRGIHYIEARDQQGKTLLPEKYELEKNEHRFSLSVSMKTPNEHNQHVISGNYSIEEIGF